MKTFFLLILLVANINADVNDIAFNGCSDIERKNFNTTSSNIVLGIYLGQVAAITMERGTVNKDKKDFEFIYNACLKAKKNNQNIGFFGKFNRELNNLLIK